VERPVTDVLLLSWDRDVVTHTHPLLLLLKKKLCNGTVDNDGACVTPPEEKNTANYYAFYRPSSLSKSCFSLSRPCPFNSLSPSSHARLHALCRITTTCGHLHGTTLPRRYREVPVNLVFLSILQTHDRKHTPTHMATMTTSQPAAAPAPTVIYMQAPPSTGPASAPVFINNSASASSHASGGGGRVCLSIHKKSTQKLFIHSEMYIFFSLPPSPLQPTGRVPITCAI